MIYTLSTCNFDNLEYMSPTKVNSNMYTSEICNELGDKIYVKTGVLEVSEIVNNVVYFKPTKNMFDFLVRFDDHNKQVALSHSKEWFKQNFTEDVINDLYIGNILPPKQMGDDPTFKVTKSDFFKLFDSNCELTQNELEIGSKVKCVFSLDNLSLMKNRFTSHIQLHQAQIYNKKKKIVSEPLAKCSFGF